MRISHRVYSHKMCFFTQFNVIPSDCLRLASHDTIVDIT